VQAATVAGWTAHLHCFKTWLSHEVFKQGQCTDGTSGCVRVWPRKRQHSRVAFYVCRFANFAVTRSWRDQYVLSGVRSSRLRASARRTQRLLDNLNVLRIPFTQRSASRHLRTATQHVCGWNLTCGALGLFSGTWPGCWAWEAFVVDASPAMCVPKCVVVHWQWLRHSPPSCTTHTVWRAHQALWTLCSRSARATQQRLPLRSTAWDAAVEPEASLLRSDDGLWAALHASHRTNARANSWANACNRCVVTCAGATAIAMASSDVQPPASTSATRRYHCIDKSTDSDKSRHLNMHEQNSSLEQSEKRQTYAGGARHGRDPHKTI